MMNSLTSLLGPIRFARLFLAAAITAGLFAGVTGCWHDHHDDDHWHDHDHDHDHDDHDHDHDH